LDKRILITGGCGFVGSNLAILIRKKYPDYKILSIDNLKRRGSELNLKRLKEHGIEFIHGDLRNKEDIEQIKEIDTIIEAAAEPSVLAGINSSLDYLIGSNFNGAINCLSLALKNKANFIYLSTSRVYPINMIDAIRYTETENRFVISDKQNFKGISTKGISEEFPLEGARSFYGATKLATELFINEYNDLYGLKTVINRCGVLTGPWQMGKVDQGVVVLWLAKHYWKDKLSYFGFGGEGKQVRDILHINDLFRLIDYQIHNMDKVNGETYNVGGGNKLSISLKELTDICEDITGNKIDIGKIKENRAADIRIYVTDNSKIYNTTGWEPTFKTREIITDIFNWLKNNESSLKTILN
jgi:CDP-paratose 2-epimerase